MALIDIDVRNSNSLNIFKSKLKLHFRFSPPLNHIYTRYRKASIYHTRLRLGMSSRLQDIPHHRRFAPIFKTFLPRRRDDLSQFKTFRPPVRRFAPTEDVSPPKLRHFEPLCKTFRPHSYRTFRPHSYRTFRTLGKSFSPRSHRTFRTLEKTFRPRSYRTFRTPEKTFRPFLKLRYL